MPHARHRDSLIQGSVWSKWSPRVLHIDGYSAYGRDLTSSWSMLDLSLIKSSIMLYSVNDIVYKAFVSFAGCDCTDPRPITAGDGLF